MTRQTTRLLGFLAAATAFAAGGRPAPASWVVTGAGLGSVKAEVWVRPNRPPFFSNAANLDAGPFASAFIPGPSGNLGPGGNVPLPPGANPATSAGGLNQLFWGHISSNFGVGGDTAGDGAADLYPSVTPVSAAASSQITTIGEQLGDDAVTFHVSWSASDTGVAQRLRAYSYDADLVFPPGYDGEVSSLPNFDTLSTLLYDTGIKVGPYDESFDFTVRGVDPTRVLLFGEAVAASVPEPAGFLLLGAGCMMLLAKAHRRRAPLA